MDSITMPNYMNRLDLIKFISETTDKYISSKEMGKIINKVCGGYGEFGDNNCCQQKTIKNIHIKRNKIVFTHENDIDVIGGMEHNELGSRMNNGAFINKLKKLNLDDEIELYNTELICTGYDKDSWLNNEPLRSFDSFLVALIELGYKIDYNQIPIFGTYILRLRKKRNEC